METEIVHKGSNAAILVQLKRGEKVKAQSGAMLAKTTHLQVHGTVWGGLGKGLTRSLFSSESFFFQEIIAETGAGDVLLAPPTPGDIKVIDLEQDWYVKGGCLLAAFGAVEMESKMQKVSTGLFSGAGLVILKLTGVGSIAVSAFGGLLDISVPPGEEYVVDNGHLVAWSGDTEYHMVKAGKGWISSVTSGEGLGCKFIGPGKVWIQTRNPEAFGGWVKKFVPARSGISLFGI